MAQAQDCFTKFTKHKNGVVILSFEQLFCGYFSAFTKSQFRLGAALRRIESTSLVEDVQTSSVTSSDSGIDLAGRIRLFCFV